MKTVNHVINTVIKHLLDPEEKSISKKAKDILSLMVNKEEADG